jgi:hypothetical protein
MVPKRPPVRQLLGDRFLRVEGVFADSRLAVPGEVDEVVHESSDVDDRLEIAPKKGGQREPPEDTPVVGPAYHVSISIASPKE